MREKKVIEEELEDVESQQKNNNSNKKTIELFQHFASANIRRSSS